ncbi:hypothetical protein BDP27DRAFT_1445611 [Rhodocollybia butyracea]|uniref:Uncharacterized protein n=1 Tax=Rhodocollybia butyracea TaxID=206335 RepID=A0A9P5UBY6_9AGAR|nr:hypothetical protein BDP27DRAFT_1445611 [Rhodocollybia butyracea]
MSAKDCHQIVVSNDGSFRATIYGQSEDGKFESVMDRVHYGIEAGVQNVFYDPTQIYWWNKYNPFRVIGNCDDGDRTKEFTDPTLLNFSKDSENEAVYVVKGNQSNPEIHFKEIRLVENIRQITVSNNGTFTANIHVINAGYEYAKFDYELKPGVKEGDKDIIFDLTDPGFQLKERDMFRVQVVSRLSPYEADQDAKSTAARWFMFTKDSKNEAVYGVTGDKYRPDISLEQVRPISEPTPVGNARQITISNSGAFVASIYCVKTKTEHILEADVQVCVENIVFNLTKADWLKDGDNFRLKVVSTAGKAQSVDTTWLTYTKNSKNQALYDIAGSSSAPTITFKGLSPIVGPIKATA